MKQSFSKAAMAYSSVGLESRVSSSTGHELVSLLFEGFLERVQLAKLAIELGDTAAKVKHFNLALQILSEGLRTHLDLKSGGELAQNLDALYHYCSLRLLEANIKNDITLLLEVHSLIEPVAQAWKQNGIKAAANERVEHVSSAIHSGNFQHQSTAFSRSAAYAQNMFAGA